MKFFPFVSSVSGSTQSYPDAMAMAGPNYQHFTELTNDVQKLSVLETPPNNGQGMPTFIPTASQQQPAINEFVEFFNNQQQMDMKNNMNQFSNPISSTNPQTPSSIPDIILTADDGSDRALQRMLGTTITVVEFHCEHFSKI